MSALSSAPSAPPSAPPSSPSSAPPSAPSDQVPSSKPKKVSHWWKKLEKDPDGNYYSTFGETARAIYPEAKKSEISCFKKFLKAVSQDMSIIVIRPNPLWIAQHGQVAYDAVIELFATINLPPLRRRDRDSKAIFHFRELGEAFTVRDAVKAVAPQAFFVQPGLQAELPARAGQYEPLGYAWMVTKIGVRQSDYCELKEFFHV
ncbi:hypothetical protein BC937DRAFT_92150 [Endogone sp. FLAS-F59071]|nr:hypothetical protein BC937DRAFT_92150 [Endogone sp. FLAS-F59071]|eukprot:RUS21590.1 hypothetical protein BC937DRAFT_92150 [Endogone sp. FLAS-F59071]